MIIVYIIGGLLVLGLICTLWDFFKAVLSVVFAIGVAILIGWVYALIGYPMWLIWLLVAVLIICNSICLVSYLCLKSKATKILKRAAGVSKEISRIENEEIKEETKNKISETLASMGMATDAELYNQEKEYFDNMDIRIGALDNRKQELKNDLKSIFGAKTGVKVIDQALTMLTDSKSIIQEMFKKLVEAGEIKIESDLNCVDENAQDVQSWDKKLYKSTVENIEPANMLPTQRLELD